MNAATKGKTMLIDENNMCQTTFNYARNNNLHIHKAIKAIHDFILDNTQYRLIGDEIFDFFVNPETGAWTRYAIMPTMGSKRSIIFQTA